MVRRGLRHHGPEADRRSAAAHVGILILDGSAMSEGSNCAVAMEMYRRDRSRFRSDLLISAETDERGRAFHYHALS